MNYFIDEVDERFPISQNFQELVKQLYEHDPHTNILICTQKLQIENNSIKERTSCHCQCNCTHQ